MEIVSALTHVTSGTAKYNSVGRKLCNRLKHSELNLYWNTVCAWNVQFNFSLTRAQGLLSCSHFCFLCVCVFTCLFPRLHLHYEMCVCVCVTHPGHCCSSWHWSLGDVGPAGWSGSRTSAAWCFSPACWRSPSQPCCPAAGSRGLVEGGRDRGGKEGDREMHMLEERRDKGWKRQEEESKLNIRGTNDNTVGW